jgi:hypothetical protein
MELKRPVAALLTALALVGGGATLTACDAAGQDQKDGTSDSGGASTTSTSSDPLPDNSNRETSSSATSTG